MAASLILAAALPEAFGEHGGLFVLAYVGLQVGRNASAALLLPAGHGLRRTLERLTVWSIGSGILWLAGGLLAGPGARARADRPARRLRDAPSRQGAHDRLRRRGQPSPSAARASSSSPSASRS